MDVRVGYSVQVVWRFGGAMAVAAGCSRTFCLELGPLAPKNLPFD